MSCFHELAEIYNEMDIVNLRDYKDPTNCNGQRFYDMPQMSPDLAERRPWKKDAKYFTKAYISALALMKMTIHAKSGGSIEVMGMLTGKIIANAIVVMDVYQLPVEGTETRVNAQAEGYEYMVQFLESNKVNGKPEHIVGWYHSHPGYGCWLSGIDVGTQSLNQNFQDPYLALVIDPLKTMHQNKVEIGAFRTFPEEEGQQQNIKSEKRKRKATTAGSKVHSTIKSKSLPASKRQDFGIHAEKYYSLDIEIFTNEIESKLLSMLLKDENRIHQMLNENDKKSFKNDDDFINDESLNSIFQLISKLREYDLDHLKVNAVYKKRFESSFEEVLYAKSLHLGTRASILDAKGYRTLAVEETSDEDMDESDIDQRRNDKLDMSDADDAISIESSNKPEDEDEREERKDRVKRFLEKARTRPVSRDYSQVPSTIDEPAPKMKLPSISKSLAEEINDTSGNIGKQEVNELFTIDKQMKLFM